MQIPVNKQTLAVFLRDYDGRKKKTRSEKMAIMKKVIKEKKITVDDETVKLTKDQLDTLNSLYHKFVLGKWTALIKETDILALYRRNKDIGYTIHQIAEKLECTDEIVRRRVKDLQKKGILTRDVKPDNRRQGLFYLSNTRIMPLTELTEAELDALTPEEKEIEIQVIE